MNRAVALAALVAQQVAAGQASTLVGTVRIDTNGAVVHNALVRMPQLGREARSDSMGAFRIAPVPVGTWHVTIQLPGYAPVGDSVTFSSSAAVRRTFLLDRLPHVLDTVTKTADAAGQTAGIRQLERRRASGMGKFLTSTDLRGVEHRSLPSLLAGFGGTNPFNYRGYTFLASSRGKEGFSRELPRAILNDSRSPRACWVQVFVDGIRIYGIHEGGDAVDIRRFLIKQLEGVEYYRGPAETPAELSGLGAVCGTLVLWTRQ